MVFGFNTDVKVGDSVYHVQTEDRGPKRPEIDSVIYYKGQILDRRRTHYTAETTPEQIKEMVTNQHRDLVDSLKSGAFVPDVMQPQNVTVELLNPTSVALNGRLLFRLKVPAGSNVQAFLEVDGTPAERAEAVADKNGEAEVTFLMPEAAQAIVMFRAVSEGHIQALKFNLRQQT
jgi:hypothetical protein